MAQNMAVSVTLRLQDQFTGPVRALTQQLQGLTRTAQEFNRAMGGTGTNTTFGRIQNQARALNTDVRTLAGSFSQLSRSMGASLGGSFGQRQVQELQRVLGLQRQVIANNSTISSGGGGRVPNVPGGGGIFGRRGFSPNASLVDRAQYRVVNVAEQTLAEGTLALDRARTRLSILGTPDEIRQQAEEAASIYSRVFSGLSQADIPETFGEVVTQFRTPQEGLQLLLELLRVQQWQILAGDTRERAREGMLALLRGIGLSGRLTGPEGNLSLPESQGFLDAYLRARIIGGADVNPAQAFQVVKYMKSLGQTLNTEALLEAFIAMPDLRASTYGNQLNMLVRRLTGTATQAAQQAMARANLGIITERSADGPHGFQAVDEELLRSNPGDWFQRHIVGPQGYLRRVGLDPLRSSAAQIATVLRPLFSNQSAENIANMIINQRQEWMNQIRNALDLDLREERRDDGSAAPRP